MAGNYDGRLVYDTKINSDGFKKGINDLKALAKSGSVAVGAIGVAAVGMVAATSKAAIDSFAECEQLVGGVETLFKASTKTVQKYANQAYETAGLSANEYMSTVTSFSASLLQSLKGDTAKSAEYADRAVVDMSDNANKMGTDMARIQDAYQGFAKQNYTMLDNLKLGYGGTKTEMERLIADANAVKAANGEMANLSIGSFADVTEAIHIIQTEMGITGTTAKEASTTIQGSIGQAKAAYKNLLTGVADVNADIPTLVDNFSKSLVTVFDNLSPAITRTLQNLPKAISKLGNKVVKEIPKIFKDVLPGVTRGGAEIVEALLKVISRNANKIGSEAAEIADIIVKAILNTVPDMVSAGGKIVGGLIKGLSGQYPALTTAAGVIGSIFAGIKVASFVTGIVSAFQKIQVTLTAYQAAVAASQHVSTLLALTLSPLEMAVGVLTGKISLATAAQAAWNAVQAVSPTTWLVVGVMALTAAVAGAVIAYDSYLEKNSEVVVATREMAEAAQEAAERANELSESMASLNENAVTTIENANAEAYAEEKLADELFDLADQAKLTATEKQRMKTIVEQLNKSIEGLNLSLDDETGKLNLTKEAVQKMIAQKLELAKVNAIQELYTEQLKEQYKAETEAIESAKKLKEAQEELAAIQARGRTMTDGSQSYSFAELKSIKNLKESIEDYSEALKTNRTTVENSQSSMQNLADVAGVNLPEAFASATAETSGFFDTIEEQTGIATEGSRSKGNDFASGYAKGIREKAEEAYTAGKEMAQKALQGTADGQHSNSPSKDAAKLGKDYDDGYALGIRENADKAIKEAESMADETIKCLVPEGTEISKELAKVRDKELRDLEYKLAMGKISEEKYYDDLKKLRDKYFAAGTEEWQQYTEDIYTFKRKQAEAARDKEFRDLKHSLAMEEITEAEYYSKLEELRDKYFEEGSDDWQQYTEEIYGYSKKTVEDFVDKLEDAQSEAEKTMEELRDKQKRISDNLMSDKSPVEYGTIDGQAFVNLANYDVENNKLGRYNNMLKELFEKRPDLPRSVLEELQGMDIDQGMKYVEALMRASDSQYTSFVKGRNLEAEKSSLISSRLTEDEVEETKKILEDKFGQLPEDFFQIGEDSIEQFGQGFLEGLGVMMQIIREQITAEMSTLMPVAVGFASAGGDISSVVNNYQNSYNVGSSKQTITEQLSSLANFEIMERMRGIK